MLKRRKKPIEKGSWIITYSDMVTLLLCFFVLMYASSIDSIKWEVLVKSLNPSASAVSQVINEDAEEDGLEVVDTDGSSLLTDEETFDQLYWQMRRHVEESDMTEDVEVFGGEGFTFVIFRNNILFEGDRYELTAAGREILDFMGGAVASVSHLINEFRVLGHTNQADPNRPNEVRGDRFLASNRATEVLVYMQEKNIIDPRKLTAMGFGQFYPIAPFEREEDRLQNRRVEVLITEANKLDVSIEYIYEQIDR